MNLIENCRSRISRWPYSFTSVLAAIAAFGCYTCMYAFRKSFAAGIYNEQYLSVDYKIWLVIAQVAGYTISKFYGIGFIAELKASKRARHILFLIGISWLALFGFGLVASPWNIVFLFINGLPLGMIWGLVFSYLEGRKSTEFMTAVLSISLIFASGFVKTVGRILVSNFHTSEYWMPFFTGLLFFLPLVLFVFCLELIPPPTEEDQRLRVKRTAMHAADRRRFVQAFLPGIVLTVFIYILLTVMRDVPDNFEVEIWADLGINNSTIYTSIDSIISICVLILMSLLILIKNNLQAFILIHWMIITGCVLVGGASVLLSLQKISPVLWMSLTGLGLYLGYVPYNAIFFERMIATFRYSSNAGFVMYIADSLGYLGSIGVLFLKEFGNPQLSWGQFYREGALMISMAGGICAICSLIYFRKKAVKEEISSRITELNYQTQ